MTDFEASVIWCLLGTIEVLGLTSAWVARLSEGSRRQTSCQRVFLGFLALVGGATIISVALGLGCWLASGTTLLLMVLTVTCDCSRSRQAAAW